MWKTQKGFYSFNAISNNKDDGRQIIIVNKEPIKIMLYLMQTYLAAYNLEVVLSSLYIFFEHFLSRFMIM